MRKFVLIGLGVAALLGGLALGIDLLVGSQRQDIIDSGQRATGRVVAHRGRLLDRNDDAVVEYGEGGRTHRVEISGAIGDGPPIGSRVELYYLPGDPQRVATPDGESSLPWRTWPAPLYTLAAIAAIVTIAEAVKEANRKRARPMRVRRPRVRNARGVVRRNDWFSRTILGIGLAGAALAFAGAPPVGLTLALISPIVIFGYVMGVSRKVVVTPVEVLVYNAFDVIRIPRHLVKRFQVKGEGYIGILVAGHKTVEVPVGLSRLYEKGQPFDRSRAQARAIARLKALAEDIPQEANAGDPGVRRRWTTIIPLAASLAAFGGLAIAVFTDRIPSTY